MDLNTHFRMGYKGACGPLPYRLGQYLNFIMPAILSITSWFSLLYGVLSPEQICEAAKALGYDAVALTDKDNLYALPEFLYQARRFNLRAIIAAELTTDDGSILLYADGDSGHSNLCRVLSEKHCESHFSFVSSIAKDPEGLIGVSDNILLLSKLHEFILVYYRINSLKKPSAQLNTLGIQPVIIPTMAFASPADYEIHRLLCAVDANTSLSRIPSGKCLSIDCKILSFEEISRKYRVFDKALEHTAKLADSIHSRSSFGSLIFPELESPGAALKRLTTMAYDGAKRRYGKMTQTVSDRLKFELDLIGRKGFASYFLIVEDIVRKSPRTCGC